MQCSAVDEDILHIWYINGSNVDVGSHKDNVVMLYATIVRANKNDIFVNKLSEWFNIRTYYNKDRLRWSVTKCNSL